MTLHPQARAALAGPPGVAFTFEDPEPARKSMVDSALADCGPGPAVEVVADVTADGVPCRLYRSEGEQGPAAIVYAHGGGWALGSLDTHDALCRELAVRSGLTVLAVDYRLAPEHPHPAAIEDVETAAAWLRQQGPDRLVVAGDSAGGQVAAVVARRARDRGVPYRGQVLVYPALDPAQSYAGGDEHGLGAESMRLFWDAFAPPGVDRGDPDVDPFRADLAGLPPALVITAEYDVLRDEGERYTAALAEAGVPAVGVRYVGMIHGFARKLATFSTAASAVEQIAATAATMVA